MGISEDRFIVQNKIEARQSLHNLEWEIDADQNIIMRWSWPDVYSIKIVVVFEVETGEESLLELLSKNKTIITKELDLYYKKPLIAEKCRFKLFPAYFGKGDSIVILNQLQGNVTDFLYRKIFVNYKISSKSVLFSDYRKINIQIELSEPDRNIQNMLIYEKYINNELICKYPMDNSFLNNGAYFYIKKQEHIEIKVLENYKEIVMLNALE